MPESTEITNLEKIDTLYDIDDELSNEYAPLLSPSAQVLAPNLEKGIVLEPLEAIGDEGVDEADEMITEAIIGQNEIIDHGVVAGLVDVGRSVARIVSSAVRGFSKVPPSERAAKWDEAVGNNQIGRAYGTGWILGSKRKVLITNNHVLPLKKAATSARIEFGYERDMRNDTTRKGKVMRLKPDDLFFTSSNLKFGGLDYTVVALREQAPEELGFLAFDPANSAAFATQVFVVQHPGGNPKAYVVNYNRKVNISDKYLTYTSDTKGGSSGSPLFDEFLNLIGIHHIGNNIVTVGGRKMYTNLGSRMEMVVANLAQQLHTASWNKGKVEEWFGEGAILDTFAALDPNPPAIP